MKPDPDGFIQLIQDAVRAEREACARIADDLSQQWQEVALDPYTKETFRALAQDCADTAYTIANAIRARETKQP